MCDEGPQKQVTGSSDANIMVVNENWAGIFFEVSYFGQIRPCFSGCGTKPVVRKIQEVIKKLGYFLLHCVPQCNLYGTAV